MKRSGSSLSRAAGKDLYSFWGERITEQINQLTYGRDDRTIVDLASNEYFQSLQPKALAGPVITPVFKDVKNG